MRHLLMAGLAAVGLMAVAAPASAQSMNVPAIVDDVLGQICVPYARTGDVAAAIGAAEALGYAIIEDESGMDLGSDRPWADVQLTRRHHGTVTLELSYGRGLCSVGIHEGGASNMVPAAEPYMEALGLEPLLLSIEGQSTTDMAVWRSGTTQLVISRSPRFSPGSEMVLSFELP
jgi:hypothetical protein